MQGKAKHMFLVRFLSTFYHVVLVIEVPKNIYVTQNVLCVCCLQFSDVHVYRSCANFSIFLWEVITLIKDNFTETQWRLPVILYSVLCWPGGQQSLLLTLSLQWRLAVGGTVLPISPSTSLQCSLCHCLLWTFQTWVMFEHVSSPQLLLFGLPKHLGWSRYLRLSEGGGSMDLLPVPTTPCTVHWNSVWTGASMSRSFFANDSAFQFVSGPLIHIFL